MKRHINIEDSTYRELLREADEQGVPLNAYVNSILWDHATTGAWEALDDETYEELEKICEEEGIDTETLVNRVLMEYAAKRKQENK